MSRTAILSSDQNSTVILKSSGIKEDIRQTISTRESALNLFFEWLGKQGISLKELSPADSRGVLCSKQSTWLEEDNNQSICPVAPRLSPLRSRRGWCVPGLAETIQSPRIYSMAGLPEGPSWEQVQRLIANLNTERPSHIRDRAIVLLLAVYGLRIGEVCALTLDDLDWANEKIRVRRLKNKRTQEFPLTAEVGNAILKYFRRCGPDVLRAFFFFAAQTA